MRRIFFVLSVALIPFAIGCEKPQPVQVPPASVPTNDGADIKIDTGGPRGVDVKVDVDPAPGGPAVDVDVDRPANP